MTVLALTVPRVSRVSMTSTRFRVGARPTALAARAPRGTRFKFTLKAPAKITVAITHPTPGVRDGKRCVASPATRRARGRICTHAVKVGTLTRANLPSGPNTIACSGRIARRALSPGAYKAILSARNAKGRSKPTTVAFSVVT